MKYVFTALSALLLSTPAFAFEPTDGALGMQPAATRIAERIHDFHSFLVVIITVITIFVLALLLYVMLRHNRRANPTPRKFSHNTLVEVVWTVVPALILVLIAAQSFPNLYYQDVVPNLEKIASDPEPDTVNHYPEAAAKGFINVKAQGNQWNWTYTYPDHVDPDGYPIEFVSNPMHVGLSSDPADAASGPRNLSVDYPMVVPVNRYVRYYTAAADVIHSWTVPAFGVKLDAVPGRLNEGWFLVEEEGTYYGQCSELCGVNHAYMPIEVRVVSEAAYQRWVEIMLTGDYDAAAASVRQIASTETNTQLAANEYQ